MRGVSALLIAIMFVMKYQSVDGTPVSDEEHVTSVETQRRTRIFHPAARDWPSFPESWSLPSFPSLSSVSGLFKGDDDDLKPLKKRIEKLEKAQRELHGLLGKMSAALATKSPPCDCKEATAQLSNPGRVPPILETGQNEKAKPKPEESGIASDKKESEAQNSKDQAQSGSTAMKGDESSAAAPTEKGDAPPNAAPTKTDGLEEAALEKNDDKGGNAPAEENEQRETSASAKEDGEKAGAIKETEKLEKPAPLGEFMNSQVDHSNGGAQFETPGNNAAGNNTPTEVPDTDEGNGAEPENVAENALTVAGGKEAREVREGIIATIVIKAPSSEVDSDSDVKLD